MSSSIVNLQCMIYICTDYGLIMGITFGHVMSNCLAIYSHSTVIYSFFISANGVNLLWVTKIRYLGIFINNDSQNLFDVSKCITKFYGRVYSMTAHISNNNEFIAFEILENQCSPVLL